MALITPTEYRAITKRNKYGVAPKEKRTWRGIVFDSKREMEVAIGFDALLNSGVLERVDRQVPYPIKLNGKHICNVRLDFKLTYTTGEVECVEVKGKSLPVWNLKKKLLLAAYPGLNLKVVK